MWNWGLSRPRNSVTAVLQRKSILESEVVGCGERGLKYFCTSIIECSPGTNGKDVFHSPGVLVPGVLERLCCRRDDFP